MSTANDGERPSALLSGVLRAAALVVLVVGLRTAVRQSVSGPVRVPVVLDLLAPDPCAAVPAARGIRAAMDVPSPDQPISRRDQGTKAAGIVKALRAAAEVVRTRVGGGAVRRDLHATLRLPAAAELVVELAAPARENSTGAGAAQQVRPRAPLAVVTTGDRTEALALVQDGPRRWRGAIAARPGRLARLEIATSPELMGRVVLAGRQRPIKPALELRRSGPDRRGDRAPARRRPLNVLLYVIDTLRADHLSLYGYRRPTTPELETLAQKALVFDAIYAPGPSTLGSIPAMMSSIRPSAIPVKELRRSPEPTLAERFSAAGYRTAAFLANPVLRGDVGFKRGFEIFEIVAPPPTPGSPFPGHDARRLHETLLEWLEGDQDRRPLFLWVQSFDPHYPYEMPADLAERFPPEPVPPTPRVVRPLTADARAMQEMFARVIGKPLAEDPLLDPGAYDASIAYADRELSRLLVELERRGLLENTIVAITSDHGEALGNLDDGTVQHGHSLHEEIVRVPLVISIPGGTGARVGGLASLMDLAPALLGLAGMPPTSAAISGEACPPIAVGQRLGGGLTGGESGVWRQPVAGWFVREGRWKLLVDGGKPRLFDLETDPLEARDVAADHPLRVEQLVQRGRARGADGSLDGTKPGTPEALDHALESALRTLGYVE